MPGTARRDKPLKAVGALADSTDVTLTAAAIGDLLQYNGAQWVNATALTGSYTIAGTLTVADITVTDDLTIADALSVGGSATVGGTLSITGALAAAATTLASLTVSGTSVLTGAVTLADALTGVGFSFSGSGTVAGTLAVTGALSSGAASVSTLAASGNAVLSSTLSVALAASFLSDVFITEDVQIGGTLAAAGAVSFGGVATLSGDLNHDGASIGFFGTTPVAQAGAFTQTYSTASHTHAAITSATLVATFTTDDPTITPDAAVVIADGDTPTVQELLEYCIELNDQMTKVQADLENAKQVINAVVDDQQAYGLFT